MREVSAKMIFYFYSSCYRKSPSAYKPANTSSGTAVISCMESLRPSSFASLSRLRWVRGGEAGKRTAA